MYMRQERNIPGKLETDKFVNLYPNDPILKKELYTILFEENPKKIRYKRDDFCNERAV